MSLKTPANINYYDPVANWSKIKPHLRNKNVSETLVRDFSKFTEGMWGRPFKSGQYPSDFESEDWQSGYVGRRPEFWKYVKHAACHWLVGFNLALAMLVEPDRKWRILEHPDHSTTWDGVDTLFDFNFLALGIPPAEAFRLASAGVEHAPGEYIKVPLAQHYTTRVVICPLLGIGFAILLVANLRGYAEVMLSRVVRTLKGARQCAYRIAKDYGVNIDDQTRHRPCTILAEPSKYILPQAKMLLCGAEADQQRHLTSAMP